MRYIKAIYIGLIGMMLAGCQADQWEGIEGGFQITLSDEATVTTKSTPAELGEPTTDKFKLKIVNEATNNAAYDGAYKSGTIPAAAGTYTVTATFGENPVLALDDPYYKGEKTSVVVKDGETTSVNISCSVANALATIFYADTAKFDEMYSSYGVEVKVNNYNYNYSVTIGDGTKKSAYYQAGSKPTFTFKGVLKGNNKEVSKVLENDLLSSASTFEARQHCKLTLSLETTASGLVPTISKAETTTVTINETIPMEWLPAPKVNGFNDDNQTSLTYTETEDALSAQLRFSGSLAIQDVEFSFEFEDPQEKFQALNDTSFLLSELTEDDRSLLNAASIILPNLDGTNSGQFDFTAMTSSLQTKGNGEETTNTIKLRVKANNRWSSEEPISYEIKTVKPIFSVSAYPGNIWTKEFTMNALMESQVESGDYRKLKAGMEYQFSANGESNWENLNDDLRQTNLTPGTNYYIRGLYRGKIASEITKVQTYPVIELENGDMEDWNLSEIGYYYNTLTWNKNPLRTYNPWSENNQYWNTNNDFTTRHRDQWSPPFSTIYYYNSFPAVSHTKDVHGGNWAAELRNTAAGRGNTSSSSSSYDFNNVPGELFIGDINVITNGTAVSPNDSYEINKGKEFKSRPTGIRFYYKYSPYTTDSWKVYIALYDKTDKIIAENEITNGESVTSYKEININFNYIEDTDIMPAKIYIYFASSVNSGSSLPYHSTNVTTWYNDSQRTDKTLSGSIFIIDDISLVYDK